MNANKELIIPLILLQSIYFFWMYELHHQLILIIIFTVFIVFFISMFLKNKNNLVFPFIIFLLIASLGTVASEWDAQAIWLFQSKKLFFDDNFWIAKDRYIDTIGNFYHPYYPKLYQTISASIAKSFGFWNEILPKLASLILITPPLIFISKKFKSKSYLILFFIFSLFILGRYFINGYIDGIIAIYFLTSMIVLKDFYDTNFPHRVIISVITIFLLNNVLLTLKEEGLAIVFSTGISMFFISLLKMKIFNTKILGLLVFAYLLPIVIFFFTYKFPLHDLIPSGKINNLIFDITQIEMIFNYEKFFIITSYMKYDLIIFILILFLSVKLDRFEWYKIYFMCISIYWTIIIYVYLISPFDIEWHLATSYKRISMGIKLTLFFMLSEMLPILAKSYLKRIFVR